MSSPTDLDSARSIATPPALRPATDEDVDAIAAVWHGAWSDSHLALVPEKLLPYRRLEDFHARVPSRIPGTTVADSPAGVVGFVAVRDDELEQLFVAASARGTGVAAALLAHGERAIAARFEVAWLAVALGNARARRFYERQGWRDAGAIAYAAEIPGDCVPVPCRRYEKVLEGQSKR